jgi:flagellar hook-length control protein FliK
MNSPAPVPTQGPAVDPPAGSPQTEAPPDAVFAALLNIQTARTAPAEGQTTDKPKAPDATTAAELVAALPIAAPLAPVPATLAKVTPATPGTVPSVAQAAAPAAPVSAPDAPTKQQPQAAGVTDAPQPQPATPALPAHEAKPARPGADPPTAKPAQPAVPHVETKAAPKDSPKPLAPQTPQPEIVATQPEERPVVAHGAPEPRPVLRGERVEALVRLATRHGAAEARMELHPQELGSVVVKLRMTSDGLQATFTASNPEALGQLQQAGDDLRRSLEAKGLTLATLDVRAEADQAGEERREPRGWARTKGADAVEQIDDEPLTVTTSIPAGELVDVHA